MSDRAYALQENPSLRERFGDLHPPLAPQAAVIEASRCLNCFDAPCTAACPTHIDVPGFIKRIAGANLLGSARKILDSNVLAASCSRVCPVQVLCEGACVLNRQNEKPIEIGRLQRHAMEAFHASGAPLLSVAPKETKERVACIGAGPASLACAAELRRHGVAVTVYERRALPGGLNTYGVAEYKLRAADSLREIELIRDAGVEFVCNTALDTAEALADLEKNFDAIFLGLGLGAMQKLGVPGEELPGVMNALELIAAYKTGHIEHVKGTAVIIGAGNTAIDAASAARRLGADPVYMVYRRAQEHIPAFDFEYEHAQHEGIHFLWLTQPMAIRKTGERLALDCLRTEIVAGHAVALPGSEFTLECDLVIPAIGQSSIAHALSSPLGIEVRDGRIVVERRTGQTANPRYFAGGDCVNGGREVVDAVADGKRAALGILQSFAQYQEQAHG